MKREAQGTLAQFLRHLDPNVVGLAPSLDVDILLGGNGEVAAIHGYVPVQARQQQGILELRTPIVL